MVLASRLAQRLPVGTVANSFLHRSWPTGIWHSVVEQQQQRRQFSHKDADVQEFMRSLPKAKYGGSHTVTLLPGEGIGPELAEYVKQIFRSTGVPVIFEEIKINPEDAGLEDLEHAITSIRRNGAALKGNIETRSLDPNIISRDIKLRKDLDLYASVFHCQSFPGVAAKHKDIDVVVIRQNTDGEYAMMEHEAVPGVVESLKVMTAEHAERLARFAFQYAVNNERKKLTTVHKANIMKVSDGMFLEVAREVAKEFPEIKHNDMIIDNCCMQLVSNPQQFDVMLSTNLYSSIIVNLIGGLTKGQGLFAGQAFSDEYGVFETATRNTGTKIAGQNVANPIAFLMAAANLLEYLNLDKHSERLKIALQHTVNVDRVHTPDLGGSAKGTDVVEKVAEHMYRSMRG